MNQLIMGNLLIITCCFREVVQCLKDGADVNYMLNGVGSLHLAAGKIIFLLVQSLVIFRYS